jgi:hypothetical protein
VADFEDGHNHTRASSIQCRIIKSSPSEIAEEFAELSDADRIDARIPPCATPLQAADPHKPSNQVLERSPPVAAMMSVWLKPLLFAFACKTTNWRGVRTWARRANRLSAH